jgi:hypothetical protein
MRKIAFALVAASSVMVHAGASAQGPRYGSGACPNRQPDWNYLPPRAADELFFNVLGIDDRGWKTWNGTPVPDDVWMTNLRQSRKSALVPMVILRPSANTGCEEVIRLRRIMADLLDCEQYCKEGPQFDGLADLMIRDR